ncbi:MAG: excinuclease ABC subunit UvrA [Bacteroidales bacterium]|nr:excinuclease ABC subunit UvrA [Bacteroidales bacterium]
MADNGSIVIRRARVNNLKDVTVEIPRGKFVVVTGISGSGKSSLAFDTLFAEGQRRFAESLSSYARQFLGRMSKPDVESIDGIPPAVAIEQKVNIRNPRSTVATTTEIYDYLRLLFARIGRTYSPVSGQEVKCNSSADVMSFIFDGEPHVVYMLSDLGWNAREDKVELMLKLKEEGYSRFFSDGAVIRIEDVMQRSATGDFPDDLYLLVDRMKLEGGEPDADLRTRALASADTAFTRGAGTMLVSRDGEMRTFVNRFELDGMTFRRPDEYMFSFNSPLGACPTCGGLGKIIGVSEDLVIPDKTKSIYDGAIACWRGDKMGWFKDHLVAVSQRYGIPVFEPYCQLSEEVRRKIWEGVPAEREEDSLIGIDEFFRWIETQRYKIQYKYMLSRFSGRTTCPDCHGSRLRKDALYVKVGGKDIHEVLSLNVEQAIAYFSGLELNAYERSVVKGPLDEILSRLRCIEDVGLGYLTLNRACNTLSGGESQRINLVTALGSSLVGSMYILDEPSIGLHSRDTDRLIAVLRRLRDIGNTVIVVEHDEEIIRAADVLIDMGPRAGVDGGQIVFQGSIGSSRLTEKDYERSLTLQYLSGRRPRLVREKRPWHYSITVKGAMEHNLKDIDVKFPLGVLTVVTGVSGSGKSSLVGDILYPAMYRRLNESGDLPGLHRGLAGNLDRISRIEYVDQNPIGRSTRSNAVTYLKAFDDIRKLMADQQYARINGFGPNYFSFNQDGGRCPECQGDGFVKIEMQFMADVTMVCESCGGKRFKPDILEVRYNGKNIDDILNLSVDEAIAFFSQGKEPLAQSIARKLQPLVDVGLGYIKLGQSSSTLSGGESQRIKLAYFLAMSESGSSASKKILFLFDEPTTGLHFYDVEKLIKAFDVLLSKGHSLVVVEHNLDVIRAADWVIDLGPDAGDKGGEVVFEGTPEDLVAHGDTFTARYLRESH